MIIERKQIQTLVKLVKNNVRVTNIRQSMPVVFDPETKSMTVVLKTRLGGENTHNKILFRTDISYSKIPKLFGIKFSDLEAAAGKDGFAEVVSETEGSGKSKKVKRTLKFSDAGIEKCVACTEPAASDVAAITESPSKWIESNTFLEAFSECVPYLDKGVNHYALANVLLNDNNLVVTDGKRMLVCSNVKLPKGLPKNKEGFCLIPRIALPKKGTCMIGVTKSFFVIKLPDYEVFVNSAAGRFPNWQIVMPVNSKKDIKFTFTESTVAKLKEVLPHLPDSKTYHTNDSIYLSAIDGKVVIESISDKVPNVRLVTDTVCKKDFPALRINKQYFRDALSIVMLGVTLTKKQRIKEETGCDVLLFEGVNKMALVMTMMKEDTPPCKVESVITMESPAEVSVQKKPVPKKLGGKVKSNAAKSK